MGISYIPIREESGQVDLATRGESVRLVVVSWLGELHYGWEREGGGQAAATQKLKAVEGEEEEEEEE